MQQSIEVILERMDAIEPNIRQKFIETIIAIESKQFFAVPEAARLNILNGIIGGFNLGMEWMKKVRS